MLVISLFALQEEPQQCMLGMTLRCHVTRDRHAQWPADRKWQPAIKSRMRELTTPTRPWCHGWRSWHVTSCH